MAEFIAQNAKHLRPTSSYPGRRTGLKVDGSRLRNHLVYVSLMRLHRKQPCLLLLLVASPNCFKRELPSLSGRFPAVGVERSQGFDGLIGCGIDNVDLLNVMGDDVS